MGDELLTIPDFLRRSPQPTTTKSKEQPRRRSGRAGRGCSFDDPLPLRRGDLIATGLDHPQLGSGWRHFIVVAVGRRNVRLLAPGRLRFAAVPAAEIAHGKTINYGCAGARTGRNLRRELARRTARGQRRRQAREIRALIAELLG